MMHRLPLGYVSLMLLCCSGSSAPIATVWSNETLPLSPPSGTFEHTLTDLIPSNIISSTASTVTSSAGNASVNATTTSTTLVVSEYTAINGSWLPSVETATAVPNLGLTPPTETFASTITINGSAPVPPLTAHDASGTKPVDAGGGGIGAYIWSGLGGAPGVTPTPVLQPTSTNDTSTGHTNSTEGTTTRTSPPMLAAARGGATAVGVSFGEVLGLSGMF
ncbi:hypothetical protein E6O75_ATG08778 [Venturia nashicola]|uniref:Uncharacterized protein n=1 Tax=Venturia nashicola TaxID=86259 RepID=A0A4Z1P2S4_9PEZI|nr:hypothetical protein E6O75_ATG08778 [Venturia nashicola]